MEVILIGSKYLTENCSETCPDEEAEFWIVYLFNDTPNDIEPFQITHEDQFINKSCATKYAKKLCASNSCELSDLSY